MPFTDITIAIIDRVHIVASRVRISDGSTVSDSWDYYKNQKAIRDLEKKYELTPVQCSWDKERSSMTWPELKYLKKTGDRSVRLELQDRLDDLAFDCSTMPELFAKMALAKIGLQVWSHDKGNVTGISYSLDGVSYPGYKLGKAYSFFGLQKYRNITCEFDKNSDFTQITALKIDTKSIIENILNEAKKAATANVPAPLPKELQLDLKPSYQGKSTETDDLPREASI